MTSAALRLLPISFLLMSSITLEGGRTGNPGDPMRSIFDKARGDAAVIMSQVDPASDMPDSLVDASERARLQIVRTKLTEPFGSFSMRYLALIDAIHASKHVWYYDVSDQPTCAMTNVPGDDPLVIRLSMPLCRLIFTEPGGEADRATWLLMHEASHHVGIINESEESLADDIATFILKAWKKKRDHSKPLWTGMPTIDAPDMRYLHTLTWTSHSTGDARLDDKFFVWGGCNTASLPNREDCTQNLDSGAILDFSNGSSPVWSEVPRIADFQFEARRNHVAFWTGKEAPSPVKNGLLIFGGCNGRDSTDISCSRSLRDSAFYQAETKTWQKLSDFPQNLRSRVFSASGWTGKELIVWGGLAGYDDIASVPEALGDGARLVFHQDGSSQWLPISGENAPGPVTNPETAIFDGKMFLFGGCKRPGILRCRQFSSDLMIYDPAADDAGYAAWKTISAPSGMSGRVKHSMAIADNRYILIWGGMTANGCAADGLVYDLALNHWRTIPALLPRDESGRCEHQSFWDGAHKRLVVWGGINDNGELLQTAMALEFTSDMNSFGWQKMITDVNPMGRKGVKGIWTGQDFLIWGGLGDKFSFLNMGDILHIP